MPLCVSAVLLENAISFLKKKQESKSIPGVLSQHSALPVGVVVPALSHILFMIASSLFDGLVSILTSQISAVCARVPFCPEFPARSHDRQILPHLISCAWIAVAIHVL